MNLYYTLKLISNKPIPKILIIDQIGILANLYKYSDIAFVGGGFSGKLHNILEAAAQRETFFYLAQILISIQKLT